MTSIQRDCDRLFQQAAVKLDPYCRKCGQPSTAGHHIMGRANLQTRYMVQNGAGMCKACHKWAHSEPLAFKVWIKKDIGYHLYDGLFRLSKTICKEREMDFKAIQKDLKSYL